MKLEFTGGFDVTTDPSATYDFLMDPDRLAPLLPMFKELRAVSEDGFTVVLEVGVPQIRGRVETVVKRLECVPGTRARFDCRARHSMGMADSVLGFDLTPSGSGSRIEWQCQCVVRGTLASLAGGVLTPLAKRNIAAMIDVLQVELGAPAELAAAHVPQPAVGGFLAKLWAWLRSLFRSR